MEEDNAFSADSSHETLYRELFTPLFRYFVFRTKDKEVAEDLTQSTFLKFLLQEDRPHEKQHIKGLLYTIARTLLIDYYRASARRPHVSLEANLIDPADEEQSAEATYSTKEDIAYVKELLAELSDTEEEIISLRIMADMEYRTIAEITGYSEANVRQLYSRALKKLRGYAASTAPSA